MLGDQQGVHGTDAGASLAMIYRLAHPEKYLLSGSFIPKNVRDNGVDPNPLVGAQGIQTLRNAGIQVDVGCLPEECWEINKEFMERMQAQASQ